MNKDTMKTSNLTVGDKEKKYFYYIMHVVLFQTESNTDTRLFED